MNPVNDAADQAGVPVSLCRQFVSWSGLRSDGLLGPEKLKRHTVWMQCKLSLSPMQVIDSTSPFAACGAVFIIIIISPLTCRNSQELRV